MARWEGERKWGELDHSRAIRQRRRKCEEIADKDDNNTPHAGK